MANSNPMLEAADRLKALRDRKAELDAEIKAVNAEIEAADRQLTDLMMDTETQNFTHAGTMFCLTTKVRASAVAGLKNELFAALRNTGHGDLVTETVNANSLSSFVKEQIECNDDVLPEWLNGLVNVFEQTTVGVRKASR